MILSNSFYARPTLVVARALLGKYLVFQPSPGKRPREGVIVGRIVETEAYRGAADKACHASWRRRESCAVLWGRPGRAYVYFTYGMYSMLNIVTEKDNFPAAVLIRAVEPVAGLAIMVANRGLTESGAATGPAEAFRQWADRLSQPTASPRQRRVAGARCSQRSVATLRPRHPLPLVNCNLRQPLLVTNGPGKLTLAFGIDYRRHNGLDVTAGQVLWVEDRGEWVAKSRIVSAERIGVAYAGAYARKKWRFYLKDSPFVSRR